MTGDVVRVSSGLGRDFRLYSVGRAVSVIGDRFALITLLFLVVRDSGNSGIAVALFYASRGLPTVLGGLVAGVVVDHFNRRRMMLITDLTRAILFVTIPTLASFALWSLFPVVFVLYSLTLLFNTAVQAALPDVVPEMRMLRANAILSAIQNVADVGYAAGAGLVLVFGYTTPLYIDAATFLFSFGMIALTRFPSPPSPPLPDLAAVWRRITAGLRYTADTPFLRWTSVTFFVSPLAGGAALVLGPLYAARVLSHSPWLVGPLRGGVFRFSVLEVAIGLGAFVGSALVEPMAKRIGNGRMIAFGVAASGLADVPLAFTTNMLLAVAMMAISGFCISLGVIPALTLMQRLTPTEMRGRVVAARLSLINGALALGSLLGGLMLVTLSFRNAWLVEAILIVGGSLFTLVPASVRGQR